MEPLPYKLGRASSAATGETNMHELAIVQKIVNAANKAAEENGIKSVAVLRLRLGQMAAAHPEQLRFGFATYAKGSRLENASLEIEGVKVVLKCSKCNHEFHDERFDDHDFAHELAHAPLTYIPTPCPKCRAENATVIHGRELELIGLEGE